MLMLPARRSFPHHVLSTMKRADRRLLRLVTFFSVALTSLSVMVSAAFPACTTTVHLVNESLDQMTLLMFALLPVLYYSGSKAPQDLELE